MAVSQNGWSANDVSLTTSISVPGGKLRVRKGGVAVIMQFIAEQFHSKVEPLKWPGNWGYAERPIRGGSSLSNHASGTAIDLNAPAHWLGARGTFTSRQVKEIRKILAACEGTIRWGGDYKSRADEMHFEIVKGSSEVNRVAKKLRGKLQGSSIPAIEGGGSGGSSGNKYGDPKKKYTVGSRVMKLYSAGTDVTWLQKKLKALKRYTGGEVDGYYGPAVKSAVKHYQESRGLSADGIAGKNTIQALKENKKMVSKKKPAKKKKAPGKGYAFPLPKGHYFGGKSGGNKSVSGFYGRRFKGVLDRTWIKRFANQLSLRGWSIGKGKSYLKRSGNDGLYGSEYIRMVKAFQRDQGLKADGLLGKKTWDAAFQNPVT